MKRTYIIILLLLILPNINGWCQDSFGKRKNIARETLSENNNPRSNDIQKNPFDPGGGGEGDPIPINGGLIFLIIGSVVYFVVTRKSYKKV